MRKALLITGGTLLVAVAALAAFVASRQHLTFGAPYPHVIASTDSTIVARGHYIVRCALA
jgi:protein-S-isoprenylcysteine O-methyltransferase Ste14